MKDRIEKTRTQLASNPKAGDKMAQEESNLQGLATKLSSEWRLRGIERGRAQPAGKGRAGAGCAGLPPRVRCLHYCCCRCWCCPGKLADAAAAALTLPPCAAAAELNHTNLEAAQHARVTSLNKVRCYAGDEALPAWGPAALLLDG